MLPALTALRSSPAMALWACLIGMVLTPCAFLVTAAPNPPALPAAPDPPAELPVQTVGVLPLLAQLDSNHDAEAEPATGPNDVLDLLKTTGNPGSESDPVESSETVDGVPIEPVGRDEAGTEPVALPDGQGDVGNPLLPVMNLERGPGALQIEVFDKNGRGVPDALVRLPSLDHTARTAAKGELKISGLPVGPLAVEISKSGYTRIEVEVEIQDGPAPTKLSQGMELREIETDDTEYLQEEYDVVEEYVEESSFELILGQAESPSFVSGIGQAEFSRVGVSDAAGAVSKISGANIVGGRYAVVRGLGDRYSNTLVNASQISSADPSKKAVQLDLFPADLIESVSILKTFTPDLPAEFAGGTVAIQTLRFPEERILEVGIGTGWNANLTGSDMWTIPGREFDFLGRTGDSFPSSVGRTEEGLPVGYQGTRPLETAAAAQRQAAATAAAVFTDIHLSAGMRPDSRKPRPGTDLSFLFADTFALAEQVELGTVLAFTRSTSDTIRENVVIGRLFDPGADGRSFTADDFLNRMGTEDQYTAALNWGALASLGLRMGEHHEIGVTLFKNSSNEDRVSIADRQRRSDGDNLSYLPPARTPGGAGAFLYTGYEILEPLQRELSLGQLTGSHTFGDPEGKAAVLDWAVSHSSSLEDRPHSRALLYYILDYTDPRIRDEMGDVYDPELGVLVTAADVPAATQGTSTLQSFRETLSTEEDAKNARADLTVPLLWKDKDNFWNVKVGTNSFERNREVRGRFFTYELPAPLNLNLNAGLGEKGVEYLEHYDGALTANGLPRFNGWTGQGGRIRSDSIFISEGTKTGRTVRNVDAFSEVEGIYAMSTLRHGPWTLVGGARIEKETRGFEVLSGLNQESFVTPRTEVTNTNAFPGITLSRTLGRDDSVTASLAWSRTIARPTFYEFAPVQTQDQATGDIIVGNPDLEDTIIDNYDMRVSWSDSAGTSLSAALFHKSMESPIAQAYDLTRKTWVNGTQGSLQGIELEARRSLGERWSLVANYTFLNSLLQYEQVVGNSGTQLIDSSYEGQPAHIFNLILGYDNEETGLSASLVYNFTGSYLTGVPLTDASPGIQRDGFHSLDLILSKSFDILEGVGIVKLKFGNLLDETDIERFEDTDLIYRSFQPGRSVSLSFEMEF